MNGGIMAIKTIPPQSYAVAIWRDTHGGIHKQYVVRAMKQGQGFEVIDIINKANTRVVDKFATAEDAHQWMRRTRAP
jgi:hypothetical protein